MPVNLSIENVPDDIVERLRARAARHHRSPQGELMAIIEAAARLAELLTPDKVRRIGLRTPAEAAAIIRADRNGR